MRNQIFGPTFFPHNRSPWQLPAWERLVNGYFSQYNRILFDEFLTELVSVQEPLLVLGGPFLDPAAVSLFIQSMRIAIFLNFGDERGGFVASAGQGSVAIDLANAHERVPRLRRELRDLYGFDGFDNSPLHSSIKLFASFVARARRHQINGHSEEALLHYVIALELIFGERQAIQKSVSERVSVATHSQIGRSFKEQRTWLEKIYELRSNCVHSGLGLNDEFFLDEFQVACEICFRRF